MTRARCQTLLLTLALLGAACGESTPAATQHPETAPERDEDTTPDPSPPARAAVNLPPHGDASPAELAVVNRGSAPITLVVSDEPFRLEAREGEPSIGIGGFGPLVEGPSCACRCGFDCLQCEAPEYEERVLEPGQSYEVSYSGRVRVYDGGCFEPYALPPGPRVFTACLEGAHMPDATCTSTEVDWPVPRVELVFDGDE